MPIRPPPAEYVPGSPEEQLAWNALTGRMSELYRTLSVDTRIPQTVVIVPSLSLDVRELSKVTGFYHYEERMLVNLMLLRQPRTKIIYVTSQPLDPVVVDYYLAMLPGVPRSHAKARLVMLDCNDRSMQPLTSKVLARPRLMERIRQEIADPQLAHLVCFNSTHLERTLAIRLDIPLHASDPALADLGSKSGSRRIFREAGIDFPFGFEDLRSTTEMAEGLAAIKRADPGARRAVVKLNEGFSGEGNALFYFEELDGGQPERELSRQIADRLPTLRFEAPQESWEGFSGKFAEMGGVVESFVEGAVKTSPSVQARVNAIGEAQVISTHDQVLGGPSGQVFLGCTFPADDAYRLEIQSSGDRIARAMARHGVVGRFGIDYVSVKDDQGRWRHWAIEINLRKGGTTHPFLTLKFLTGGNYSISDGNFYSLQGKPKYYFATDTIRSDRYVGLRAEDLIDISVYHGLHFHGPTERGVVFHLIGALSEFGKLGLVAIGDNLQQARFLYRQTLQVLDAETGPRRLA